MLLPRGCSYTVLPFVALGCGQSRPATQAVVQSDSSGVRVVQHARLPAQWWTIGPEAQLVIGADDQREGHALHRVSSATRLASGHVAIADAGSKHEELEAWDETMSAARRVTSFEDRPVLVVSATAAMEGMPENMLATNHEMHAELSSFSSAGRHVKLAGTDHYSLLMHEGHAKKTAALIIELLGAVRSAHASVSGSRR